MSKTKEQETREIAEHLMRKKSEASWEPLSEYEIDRCYSEAKDIADYLEHKRTHSDEYGSNYDSWNDMGG